MSHWLPYVKFKELGEGFIDDNFYREFSKSGRAHGNGGGVGGGERMGRGRGLAASSSHSMQAKMQPREKVTW